MFSAPPINTPFQRFGDRQHEIRKRSLYPGLDPVLLQDVPFEVDDAQFDLGGADIDSSHMLHGSL
jgi:hypothetical protein